MPVVTMREMIDAGVHFGHQTHRWNPRMKRYIFTERNGTYIIDLQQTVGKVDEAYDFIKETVARGGNILFVGTKRQAQEAIAEQATRVGMPYVNHRWLGGMLTNFSTVAKRVGRLKELEQIDYDNVAGSGYTKKELLLLKREKDKLEKSLGGIRNMHKVPSMLWVVDTNKEHLAIDEAKKLNIPVVAILDTNCDPDDVSYAVPGNDDAIRSVSLLTRVIADAVAEGLIVRDAKSGSVAEEPLAEWERELLKSPLKAPAQGKLPGEKEKKITDAGKPVIAKDTKDGETKVSSYSAADIKALRERTGAGMLDVKKALDEAEGNVEKAVEALRIKGLKGAVKREGNSTAEGLVEASVNGTVGVMVEINSETDFVAKSEPFIEFAATVKEAATDSGASTVEEIMDVEVSGTLISERLVEATARLGEKIAIRRVARVQGPVVEAYLHRTSKDLPPQVGVLVAVDSTGDKAKEAAHDVAVHIAAMSPKYKTRDDVPTKLVDDERRIARETAVAEGKPEVAIEKIVEGRLGGFFKENVLLDQPFAKDPKQTIAQVFKTANTTLVDFARFKVGTE